MSQTLPRRYTDLSDWYPLITSPDEYVEESAFYTRTIIEASEGAVRTVLELGAGAGANAYHYKGRFCATLTDLSPAMLAISARINPECEHVAGDMRTIRLRQHFDAVFVHDAICYMVSESDLRAAIETAYAHLRPGGIALFAPDHTLENFAESVESGGRDAEDRALRYLIWTSDPDPHDGRYIYEFAYLLHERGLQPRVVHEAHQCGLFSRHHWLRLLNRAGFQAWAKPFEHSEEPEGSLEVFIGRKPSL